MTDFWALFQSIEAPKDKLDTISARRAPNTNHIWIGKDKLGLPVIIVETIAEDSVSNGIVLRNLRFDPLIECSIHELPGRKRRTINASVVRLTTNEGDLAEYFLRTSPAFLADLPSRPSTKALGTVIERVVEMFRALAMPSAASLQGLWAELFLLRHAPAPDYAVRAWHPTRRSLFDFDSGREAVEVKSTNSGVRKHHFKLAQLRPPAHRQIWIASLLLSESPIGPSIPDLWKTIDAKLGGHSQLSARLAEVIAQSAGSDWHHAQHIRFDEESAARSLLIFDANSIPRVHDQANPDITDIEFTSDLSATHPIDGTDLMRHEGLLKALFGGSNNA